MKQIKELNYYSNFQTEESLTPTQKSNHDNIFTIVNRLNSTLSLAGYFRLLGVQTDNHGSHNGTIHHAFAVTC